MNNGDELTDKQLNVLLVIYKFIDDNGYSPSIREICELTGLKSTATVKGYLDRLKLKGYIDYNIGEARTIRIINSEVENEGIKKFN